MVVVSDFASGNDCPLITYSIERFRTSFVPGDSLAYGKGWDSKYLVQKHVTWLKRQIFYLQFKEQMSAHLLPPLGEMIYGYLFSPHYKRIPQEAFALVPLQQRVLVLEGLYDHT
jgi:hypothetical protein